MPPPRIEIGIAEQEKLGLPAFRFEELGGFEMQGYSLEALDSIFDSEITNFNKESNLRILCRTATTYGTI